MGKKIALAAIGALVVTASPALARGGHGGGHSGGHSSSSSSSSSGEHYTRSYTTRSGTFVQGHYSTNPNGTRNDNYSTRGNVNPHTGEEGTKPSDSTPN